MVLTPGIPNVESLIGGDVGRRKSLKISPVCVVDLVPQAEELIGNSSSYRARSIFQVPDPSMDTAS